MTAQRWKEVKAVLAAVLESDRREAALDRLCEGDGELRREVESLLRAHARADGFLEPPSDSSVLRRSQ